jgi:endonuclease/exonuclease/phosphatase family metal-dependent hydrolase
VRLAGAQTGNLVLTLMTFNVLSRNRRYDGVSGSIAAEAPDVVALQEPGVEAAAQLTAGLLTSFPYRAFQPECDPSGIGVMSCYPLREVETFRLSADGHWCQRMLLELPCGPITLFNIHMRIPHLRWSTQHVGKRGVPLTYDTSCRHREVESLVGMLDAVRGPCLAMGDFNLTDRSPEYRLLSSRLSDTYAAVGKGLGGTFPALGSFPHNFPAPAPIIRLDYIWHSRQIRPLSAHLGRSEGSDHRPVVARLELEAAREGPGPLR